MKISFPQTLFKRPIKSNVDAGKNIAKKSTILFCGIARNVEKTLQSNINRANYTGAYFQHHEIFIYENDSNDNTLNILKNANIKHLSENRIDANYKEKIQGGDDNNQYNRCKVLASCRNQYLNYARNNAITFDYICVLDWDIYGWSYDGFFDSIYRLRNDNTLASISSYGVLSEYTNTATLENNIEHLLMYDSFAFRPLNYDQPLSPSIQASFNNYKIDKPTLVRSNFGGMCVYKNILLNFEYSAKEVGNYVDCDHVVINDAISTLGYKHLLNNYLIVSYSKHKHV